jgi:hypothetical protein
MRFAGAGRAEQHDVLLAGEEVELAEVQDVGLLDRALEGEVELLQRLARREAGGLDAGLAAVAVAAVDLGLQNGGDELLIAPLLAAGALGELGWARAAAGAFRTRNRCASSLVAPLMRSTGRSGPAGGPRPASRPAGCDGS